MSLYSQIQRAYMLNTLSKSNTDHINLQIWLSNKLFLSTNFFRYVIAKSYIQNTEALAKVYNFNKCYLLITVERGVSKLLDDDLRL